MRSLKVKEIYDFYGGVMRIYGRYLYTKYFVVAWSKGQMGYSHRWRFLQPFSSYFKIVLNRCEWCWKMKHNCHCFDGLEKLYD